MCDSCNADVLEYESLEKRFSQIRERILSSYKENSTIQNLNNLIQQTTTIRNDSLELQDTNNKILMENQEIIEGMVNSDFTGLADMDLVEEVQDEDLECEENENNNSSSVLVNDQVPVVENISFVDTVTSQMITDQFDFAAFNEHVAQNSLPSGVLNLSDGLVNLEVSEKSIDVQDIPLEGQGKWQILFLCEMNVNLFFITDIIIYDVNTDQIVQQDNDSCDLKNYDNTEG